MKIYFDWNHKRPLFRRDNLADGDRCPSVLNSGVGIYTLTYRLAHRANKAISFSYTEESLKYIPYEKQLEEFLLYHGLTLSDISPIPVRISIPPKEYKRLESELLKKIKKYKRVKIKEREGTYAYDEVIVHGWHTDVHIVELDEWVRSDKIETKEFHEELDKAIAYFHKYDDYGSYGVFIRDFF